MRYIRGLKRLPRYNEFFVFDVETTVEKVPKFLYSVVMYQKGNGKKHFFEFYNEDDLTNFLCYNYVKKNKVKYIFAHNLNFDFQFLNWKILTEEYDLVRLSINPTVIYFKHKCLDHRLKYIDTMNFFKTSLEKLFPEEKVKVDFSGEVDFETLKKRCLVDVILTGRLVEKVSGISASDLSFKTFRYENPDTFIQIIETPISKASYFGGRVECFLNRTVVKNAYYYDFNSLYPSVMLNPIPVKYVRTLVNVNPKDLEAFFRHENLFIFAHVNVDIPDCFIAPLPFKLNGKLVFPVGKFDVSLAMPELMILPEDYIRKVYAVELWSAKRVFSDFVKKYYELRKSNPVNKDFYKLILNSLYGKFGQKVRNHEVKSVIELGVESGFYHVSIMDMGKKDYYVFGDRAFNVKIMDRHKYNVAVSSAITSYGRAKLYVKMMEILDKGYEVYYCDTDSIITNAVLETSNQLGELKLEGKGYFLGFKSKCYIFENTLKFKGAKNVRIEDLSPELETITVGFSSFATLRNGLRKKRLKEWLEVIKQFNLIDDKRVGVGWTRPLKVEGLKVLAYS